jgi:hypothetical protein
MSIRTLLKKAQRFVSNYRAAIIAWIVIVVFILIGLYFDVDKRVLAGAAVLIGFLGHAFAALLVWIGIVPVVGPLIVTVLSLPFIWLINGIGYIVSYIAIKQGYPRDVLNYRVLTITLLVGITIGYVVGKFI